MQGWARSAAGGPVALCSLMVTAHPLGVSRSPTVPLVWAGVSHTAVSGTMVNSGCALDLSRGSPQLQLPAGAPISAGSPHGGLPSLAPSS